VSIAAKFVHTNLIAADWRKLAGFCQQVFRCTPVPPERDFQGEQLEVGTGLPGAHLRGVHLRLPGWGDNGLTLEIFNYNLVEIAIWVLNGCELEKKPGLELNMHG
jgi:hypothetical protein